MKEVVPSHDDEIPTEHDMLEPQEPPHMNISHNRNLPWAHEIIQDAERYGAPEGSSRESKKPKPFSSYVALMCDLVTQRNYLFWNICSKERMGRIHHGRILIHNEE